MDNLATRFDNSEVVQETAVVLRREDDCFSVKSDSGIYRARRAVSCFVEPRECDVVLLATARSGACYVLAVLERDGDDAIRIAPEGDVELALDSGRLSLSAREGISLVSQKEIGVVAARAKVNAVTAEAAFQRLSVVGRYLQSEFERVKTFAKSFDAVLERFSQRVKNSYRKVEGTDQVRTQQLDYRARKTMNMHGANTLMTAEQLVKIDGEQIHVG